MSMLTEIRSILVVAAHPDDEILGCGGTLARLYSKRATISLLLLGEGPTSRPSDDENGVKHGAHVAALAAARTLGIEDVRFSALPDNRFDTVPLLDIVQKIEASADDVQPDVVLTHHAGDLNQDHRITHQAVLTAFRPLPGVKAVTVLGFEILSSSEYAPAQTTPTFAPTVFVDISQHLEAKQEALRAYAGEMRQWPHPRSYEGVEYLARLRGCQCGRHAAEAFMLYRSVV